jgi:hypothetical protein
MIDFESIVESLLTEAALPSPGPHAIIEFYKNHNDELKEITGFLQTNFSIINWPTNGLGFLSLLADATSRVNASPLTPYVKQFPLMDFLWFVAEKVNSAKKKEVLNGLETIKKGIASTEIQDDLTGPVGGIPKAFLDAAGSYTPGSNPLYGYSPISTTGLGYLGVLQRKYQSDFLGEFNLKTFDDFSLKRALYGLLEIRKKTRRSIVNVDKIPQDMDWINKIILNPGDYSGKIQIPPKLKSLYDNASASQIIQIAKSFQSFYENEIAQTLTIVPGLTGTSQPAQDLESFISNSAIKDNTFKFNFSTPVVYETESPNLSAIAISSSSKGGYLIKNIKLIDSDAAKEVISLLTNFGNFISEGEPINWSGAIQGIGQMAQGIAGLGKATGSGTF